MYCLRCDKRLPAHIRYCPYCGLPLLQAMVPVWLFQWRKRVAILSVLAVSCLMVWGVLGRLGSPLIFPPATLPTPFNLPIVTATPTATQTPFPKMTLLALPSNTPTIVPTNVTVRLVIPTPTPKPADTGIVSGPFRLMSKPSYDVQPIREFVEDKEAKILNKQGEWLNVEIDELKGWVRADLVTIK